MRLDVERKNGSVALLSEAASGEPWNGIRWIERNRMHERGEGDPRDCGHEQEVVSIGVHVEGSGSSCRLNPHCSAGGEDVQIFIVGDVTEGELLIVAEYGHRRMHRRVLDNLIPAHALTKGGHSVRCPRQRVNPSDRERDALPFEARSKRRDVHG